jgi:hypothetical protein
VNRLEPATLVFGALFGILASIRAKRPIVNFAVGFVSATMWVELVREFLT